MIICELQRGSDHCFALHFISLLDFPISATDSCNGFSFQAQKQSTCQPCDSIYYYHQYYLSFRTILVLNKGGGGPGVLNKIVDFGRPKRDKKVLNVPKGGWGVTEA